MSEERYYCAFPGSHSEEHPRTINIDLRSIIAYRELVVEGRIYTRVWLQSAGTFFDLAVEQIQLIEELIDMDPDDDD